MRFAVTGATGFVGTEVLRQLAQAGHTAIPLTRRRSGLPGEIVVGDLGTGPLDAKALAGVEAVVHLAARTHVLDETAADPLEAYRRINVDGTQALLDAAVAAGVGRFVFVSSIKAVAERSEAGHPIAPDTVPHPEDAYGITKLEAEARVRQAGERGGIEVVILRPPLVYGPGVKANFSRLIKLIQSGMPLPFGGIRNRRSIVDVANLAAAIVCAGTAEGAAGRTLMVADATLSTPELIRAIADAAGVSCRLVPVPPAALRFLGTISGRGAEMQRLCGSLEIDVAQTGPALGWRPIRSLNEGLRAMVAEA